MAACLATQKTGRETFESAIFIFQDYHDPTPAPLGGNHCFSSKAAISVAMGAPDPYSAMGKRRATASRHEHELALGRRALQHLVSATSLGERQALGHDRVDLVLTKQVEQHLEVFGEPILVGDAQDLDPV